MLSQLQMKKEKTIKLVKAYQEELKILEETIENISDGMYYLFTHFYSQINLTFEKSYHKSLRRRGNFSCVYFAYKESTCMDKYAPYK